MNTTGIQRIVIKLSSVVASLVFILVPVSASAMRGPGGGSSGDDTTVSTTSETPTTTKATEVEHRDLSSGDKSKIELIHKRGENEINRRLTTMNGLIAKINATSYLTSSQKSALIAELNTQITSMQSLQTELSNEDSVTAAKDDAQKVITDYRVYAFVVPKVQVILTADRQQVIESKLSTLTAKLQAEIDTAKTAGTDVSDLQAKLDDMNDKLKAAQALSSDVETKVLALQASDFNSNHKVLKSYRDQLKTARADIGAAVSDAKVVVKGLKTDN